MDGLYNSQEGSFGVVNTSICQHCGSITKADGAPESNKKSGIMYVLLGWLFFAISLIFIPILFGAVALAMGVMTFTERSKTHGAILMFFAVMGLILGSLFSFVVSGTMFI